MSDVDSATAATVITDVYAETGSNADVCRATVRTFRSAGVLDVPGAEEAFAGHQLL
jgi:glutamate mutase epsilon subunit